MKRLFGKVLVDFGVSIGVVVTVVNEIRDYMTPIVIAFAVVAGHAVLGVCWLGVKAVLKRIIKHLPEAYQAKARKIVDKADRRINRRLKGKDEDK